MQTQSQPMTAGNMPGGGAAKSMSAYAGNWETGQLQEEKNWINQKWKPAKASPKKPVHELYTKAKADEKGSVDQSKVASLVAKSNRPAKLKRTSNNKLDKEAKKLLIAQRKEAAKKFAERSAEMKKELICKKNALKRQVKREKVLKKKQDLDKIEPSFPNISSMIYSVGPQPKYKAISSKFRQYRKFAKMQLKAKTVQSWEHTPTLGKAHTVTKSEGISYLYKVGTPVSSK